MAAALRLVDSTFPLPPQQYIAQTSAIQISIKPASVSLALYAGDDLGFTITVNNIDGSPADLTGATAIAQIKRTHSGPVIAEFNCAVAGNVVTATMPNAESVVLQPTSYIWDCRLKLIDGTIKTVAAGTVCASEAVSQFQGPATGP